jgi:hypothetical protein
MAEPIQDDIETVKKALSRRWGGDYRFPGMPEQLWKDANAALDRLVAERDRLIQRYDKLSRIVLAFHNEAHVTDFAVCYLSPCTDAREEWR